MHHPRRAAPICIAIGELDAGRLESACDLLDSLDEATANHPFVMDLRARIYWLLGDAQNATRLWRAALNSKPDYRLRESIETHLRITGNE
jgi:predicted Zn-dependent protease